MLNTLKNTSRKLAFVIFGSLLLTACGPMEEEITNTEKEEQEEIVKEVEVFRVGSSTAELTIEKTATTEASGVSNISAQTSGVIKSIEVTVGDYVEKNQPLIGLGDSLNSDLLALQERTAYQSDQLAKLNQQLTAYSAQQNIEAAALGAQGAYNNYQGALQAKKERIELFEEQYRNSEIEIDNADLNYDNAKNSLDALEDNLYDTEDDLDNIRDQIRDSNDPTITAQLEAQANQLESAIDALEQQIDNAEVAVDIARNRLDQSELALEQLATNYKSQFTQLNVNIANTLTQYQSAINQIESAQAGGELQQIAAATQQLQTEANLETTKINRAYQTVKAPIAGRITSIETAEGNIINPGQVVIKIENDTEVIVKAELNAEEAKFVRLSDRAKVIYNNKEFTGVITSISPTLDSVSRKVNVEIEINKPRELPTNSFVRVKFEAKPRNTFFIPLNSIFLNNGEKTVRIVKNNKVAYQAVEIGEVIGDNVEILSGLNKNDKVITTVNSFIQEGEKVKITQ